MKLLFDFFPLLLFFAAFKFYDIYVATAVAIAGSLVQVSVHWWRERRIETMHIVTLVVIAVFGGLTLWLRDDTFIKWKPTIVNWIFAALILGSQWIGRRTAIEHLLGGQLSLPAHVWRNVNLSWGLFFAFAGALNLYVAFYFGLDLDPETRLDIWVKFKVFGLMGLTLVFVVAQMFFIARHIQEEGEQKTGSG